MGVVAESLLLSWRDVFSLAGLLVLLTGAGVALLVARRPWLFWPLLLVVNTVGNGPRLGGYVVLDEILTGFIVAGAGLRIAVTGASRRRDVRVGAHRAVYLLLIGYLICQSAIGVIENDDLPLARSHRSTPSARIVRTILARSALRYGLVSR